MDGASEPWFGGVLAFLGVLFFAPIVRWWAHRRGWLAYPRPDRWHRQPTALAGGVALYAAVTLAVGAMVGWHEQVFGCWWGGATLLFGAGLADDLWGLRPLHKLGAQGLAALLFVGTGHALLGAEAPLWFSVPTTCLWIVGFTNAVNLIDNMDGLAAGLVAIAAGVLAVMAEAATTTVVLCAVAGASTGFLVFNFKPSQLFMGDSGSLFLGYTGATAAVLVSSEGGGTFPLAVLAALSVPVFDTALVVVARWRAGRAVARGGRDHSSHRLVKCGYSERRAVLALYALGGMAGGMALWLHAAPGAFAYVLAGAFVLGLGTLGWRLGQADVYGAAGEFRGREEPGAARALQRLPESRTFTRPPKAQQSETPCSSSQQ